MGGHQISIGEVAGNVRSVLASNSDDNKLLVMDVDTRKTIGNRIRFTVYKGWTFIMDTTDLKEAVNSYNKI